MKGKQQPHTTAATSPNALEILAEKGTRTFNTKFHYTLPQEFKYEYYSPYKDPKFLEAHSRKVREQGGEASSASIHDHYLNDIAKHLEQTPGIGKVLRNRQYSNNYFNGEFDILTQNFFNRYTYFEVKSSRCKENVKKAREQFKRALQAQPKRTWTFVLCTPLPNNEYLLEDFTEETYRNYQNDAKLKQEKSQSRKRRRKHAKKTHKRNHRRRR